jgi:hypothetical protein
MLSTISLTLPYVFIGISILLVIGMLFLHLKWLDRFHPNAELLLKFLQKLK